jgi:hypothetical protein
LDTALLSFFRKAQSQCAKQSAINYAKARAKYGRGEIRVLKTDASIEQVIEFKQRGASPGAGARVAQGESRAGEKLNF